MEPYFTFKNWKFYLLKVVEVSNFMHPARTKVLTLPVLALIKAQSASALSLNLQNND